MVHSEPKFLLPIHRCMPLRERLETHGGRCSPSPPPAIPVFWSCASIDGAFFLLCDIRGMAGGGEVDGKKTVECLRGRLLAERAASRAAKEEADLMTRRVPFTSFSRRSSFPSSSSRAPQIEADAAD